MLELKGIAKTYQSRNKQVDALRGVDFVFPQTGLVFIVGKSGSGKSTMLNVLGLLDKFDDGDLLIDGKSIKDFSEKEKDVYRALNIGFVFQEFHIIDKYTIGQNLKLPLEIQHRQVSRQDVEEVLKKVDLEGYYNRKATEISGGQKQRVAIARALIKNPRIILADEPTGSLDTANGKAVFELLQELGKERLVIVISHDIENAHKYADTIIELQDGKITQVYQGEGVRETIKLTVDKIDSKQLVSINKHIAEGKKVVLCREQNPKPPRSQSVAVEVPSEIPNVKLPLRSSFRLAMLSIKARWVRTFFTILVTMFAVAFFAFSDMVSQFNIEGLIASEVEKSGLPFMTVMAERKNDDSFFSYYETAHMTARVAERLTETGLPIVNAYQFALVSSFADYVNFLPNSDKQGITPYYPYHISGFIETSDVAEMGLTLAAGRMPQNFNEVVITNYQLEAYKIFGLSESNTRLAPKAEVDAYNRANKGGYYRNRISNITSFEDIEGRLMTPAGFQIDASFDGYPLKIVGMVEYDLSPYESIAGTKIIENVTPAQKLLYQQAAHATNSYLNKWIVMPGFYKQLGAQHHWVSEYNFYLDDNENEQFYSKNISTCAFNENFFEPFYYDSSNIAASRFKPMRGFTESDIAQGQVVINMGLANQLLPKELVSLYFDEHGRHTNWVGYYDMLHEHLFGKKLNVSAIAGAGSLDPNFDSDSLTVVGIYWDTPVGFYPTADFFERFNFEYYYSQIVPISDTQDAADKIKKLIDFGDSTLRLGGEDEQIRFVVVTPESKALYKLDDYFVVAVTIFRIAALAFFVFAIILTYNFISASIAVRKKDIGILRSLGASRFDVAKVFIIEGLLIAAAVIVFGVFTSFAGYSALCGYLIDTFGYLAQNYKLVSFGVRQILLVSGLTVGAIAASIIFPVLIITNKQPVDAIRE